MVATALQMQHPLTVKNKTGHSTTPHVCWYAIGLQQGTLGLGTLVQWLCWRRECVW